MTTQTCRSNTDNIENVFSVEQIHRKSRYKLTRTELAVATGPARRRQSRVWSELAGTEEEAAVWTGWTALSSRAFQNLPGASLKQREEEEKEEEREEVGLPAGMFQTNYDPGGTAAFNVD
ncbi:hypothetical protein NQZ68_025541 [Xyrichtys novacula]|uniref:Uncharacterized protein n=1 Tax=Xyrichtys novacula TaxID=13765 RepID=A0AAV1FR82_XYRNO|nr:hypothetical protein NQZ68_025541 [Xyrichtys novacula]